METGCDPQDIVLGEEQKLYDLQDIVLDEEPKLYKPNILIL